MSNSDRSFPEAADGRQATDTEVLLWSCGADHETAQFIADQLGRRGYLVFNPDNLGWPDIDRYHEELRKGQSIYEDCGGFFLRAIKALFGIKPKDEVVTYQVAARRMLEEAQNDPA